VVDLAELAACEVLRGRRILRRHGLRDAANGGVGVAGHVHAFGLRHGQAFGHHVADHIGHARALHEHAVGQLRDGRQRVVGAVEDQLGPQRAAHVAGNLRGHAGGDQVLRDLLAAARRRDHQFAAAVVPHVAGAGHLGRHVDHGAATSFDSTERTRASLSTPFCSVSTSASGDEVRRDLRGGRFAVGRLHAEQHEVGALHRAGFGARGQRHVFVEGLRLQPQPLARTASTCEGRPISTTSWPARASMAP
jgi:hypothetical protein